MPKHRKRRLGKVERKDKAVVLTGIRCTGKLRKAIQGIARYQIKTTCHDIVAECIGGPEGHEESRLLVRADCTSPKTKAEFEEQVEAVTKLLERKK